MSDERIKEALEEISVVGYQGTILSPLGLRSSRIAHVLMHGEPGDVIFDEQWPKDLGGIDPDGRSYGLLESARRYALSKGIVWKRVRKENRLKCLMPDERAHYAGDDIRKIRKRARHGLSVVEATDRSALSSDDTAKLNATAMILAVTERATAPATVRAIAARPDPSQSLLAEYVLTKKD